MAGEFDPVRPVHPTWPGRRVREEGDERRRQRGPVTGQDDENGKGNGNDDRGQSRDRDDHTDNPPDNPPDTPPDTGGSGRHVDDYA